MTSLLRPLFIIGLQKSGTTLLNRVLLQQPDVFFSPFKLEGRQFWGDDPPFSPKAAPCGVMYQRKSGFDGHSLGADDCSTEDQQLLSDRMSAVEAKASILINKNPYNTVRVPWLKSMFPECKIIAIVRQPMANVFSLQKKHIPHDNRGLGPEDGWWGVKPKGWHEMNVPNVIKKVAMQYAASNACLLDNLDQVDMLVSYAQLCENPSRVIANIAQLYGIELAAEVGPISSRDHEYKTGGRLLSINREHIKQNGTFAVRDADIPVELKKLSWYDRWVIWRATHQVWKQLQKHLSR